MFLWYFLFNFLICVLVLFVIYLFILDPLRFNPASRLAHNASKSPNDSKSRAAGAITSEVGSLCLAKTKCLITFGIIFVCTFPARRQIETYFNMLISSTCSLQFRLSSLVVNICIFSSISLLNTR